MKLKKIINELTVMSDPNSLDGENFKIKYKKTIVADGRAFIIFSLDDWKTRYMIESKKSSKTFSDVDIKSRFQNMLELFDKSVLKAFPEFKDLKRL